MVRCRKIKHFVGYVVTQYKKENVEDGYMLIPYRLCVACGKDIDLEICEYTHYKKTDLYIHKECE